MDDKKKTVLLGALVVVAIGAAVYMGTRSLGGEKVEVVGVLEGVSRDAEMGHTPADPSGDMTDAPIVDATQRR